MLDGALILATTLHLLAVNVGAVGPLVALWLHGREARRGCELSGRLGRALVGWSTLGLLVGGLLGGLGAWLLWLRSPEVFERTVALVPMGRLTWGLAEWGVSLACYAGYWAWWRARPGRRTWGQLAGPWLLALFGTTNALYHFPTLFAVMGLLWERPELVAGEFRFTRLLIEPHVLLRVLHFTLAAVATTGGLMMALALREPEAERRRAAVWGGCMAAAPTLAQWLAGAAYLAWMPSAAREQLLGGNLVATGCFLLAMFGAAALSHRLVAVALGETAPRAIYSALVHLVLVVTLMVAARHFARELDPAPRAGVAARGEVRAAPGPEFRSGVF